MSVEKSVAQTEDSEKTSEEGRGGLSERELDGLLDWVKTTLGSKKVAEISSSSRLSSTPALVTVKEMGAARHFVRTQHELTQDQRYMMLQPKLEISPRHPIIKGLIVLRKDDPQLAELALMQVYDNAMVAAGLLDDARPMVGRLNSLIGQLMDKAVSSKNTILRP